MFLFFSGCSGVAGELWDGNKDEKEDAAWAAYSENRETTTNIEAAFRGGFSDGWEDDGAYNNYYYWDSPEHDAYSAGWDIGFQHWLSYN